MATASGPDVSWTWVGCVLVGGILGHIQSTLGLMATPCWKWEGDLCVSLQRTSLRRPGRGQVAKGQFSKVLHLSSSLAVCKVGEYQHPLYWCCTHARPHDRKFAKVKAPNTQIVRVKSCSRTPCGKGAVVLCWIKSFRNFSLEPVALYLHLFLFIFYYIIILSHYKNAPYEAGKRQGTAGSGCQGF